MKTMKAILTCTAAFAVLSLSAASSQEAVEYRLLGTVSTGFVGISSDPGGDAFAAGASADFRHELVSGRAEFRVRNLVTVPFPESTADEVDPRFEVPEASLRLFLTDAVVLTTGKTRLPWGNAIAFPTADLFQPVPPSPFPDPLRPEGSLSDAVPEGFVGAALETYILPEATLTGAVSVDRAIDAGTIDADTLSYALTAHWLFASVDGFVSGVFRPEARSGAGFGVRVDAFETILRGEAAVELDRVETEGLSSFERNETAVTLGVERLVPAGGSDVFLFAELAWRSEANDFMPDGWAAAVGASFENADVGALEATAVFAPADGSGFVSGSGEAFFGPSVSIAAGGLGRWGGRESAYGVVPVRYELFVRAMMRW